MIPTNLNSANSYPTLTDNLASREFRSSWEKLVIGASPEELMEMSDSIQPRFKAYAIRQAGGTDNIHQKLEIYVHYGRQIFSSMLEILKDISHEKFLKAEKLEPDQVLLCSVEWFFFKRKLKRLPIITPWMQHIQWVVKQVSCKIEYQHLTLPNTVLVRNKLNESVEATLRKEIRPEIFHSKVIRLLLKINDRLIGDANFQFDKQNRSLFVTHLQNHTIYYGNREFSRVGTGLLDIIKQVAVALKYDTIELQAQTPYNTPIPPDNNLVNFYEKMGFKRTGEGSVFGGYSMKYQVTLPK